MDTKRSAVLGCSKGNHGVQVTGVNGLTVPSLHRPAGLPGLSSGATVKGPGEGALSQGSGSIVVCLASESRSMPVGRRYRDADIRWFK